MMMVMTYLGYAHHSPTPEYVGREREREGGRKRRKGDCTTIRYHIDSSD